MAMRAVKLRAVTAKPDPARVAEVLALAPDLYLYGALLESAPYIKEDGRLQTWGALYRSALDGLNNIGLTSTFNAGPMTVRISSVTP